MNNKTNKQKKILREIKYIKKNLEKSNITDEQFFRKKILKRQNFGKKIPFKILNFNADNFGDFSNDFLEIFIKKYIKKMEEEEIVFLQTKEVALRLIDEKLINFIRMFLDIIVHDNPDLYFILDNNKLIKALIIKLIRKICKNFENWLYNTYWTKSHWCHIINDLFNVFDKIIFLHEDGITKKQINIRDHAGTIFLNLNPIFMYEINY